MVGYRFNPNASSIMDSKPYLCRHCKTILGRSTESVLFVGMARFRFVITLQCGRCGEEMTWRPGRRKTISTESVLVSVPV